MFISASPKMRLIRKMIEKIAPTDMPVLIYGPSGAGKELTANAIQQLSARKNEPFIIKNSAILSRELAASELFGHVRGAFTGAWDNQTGLFTQANNGTLFLDEIGDLPLEVQPSLLRVLEDGRYRPVGSKIACQCDVRLICATNHDLARAVKDGLFNEALYHRIKAFTIELPPLAEHHEDIPHLVKYFLQTLPCAANKKLQIDPSIYICLEDYSWPGNVRQLRHVIERAVILAEDGIISAKYLPPEIVGSSEICRSIFLDALGDDESAHEYAREVCESYLLQKPEHPEQITLESQKEEYLSDRLDFVEKRHILKVLKKCNGNRKKAAERLGIGRGTLYRRLESWGLI